MSNDIKRENFVDDASFFEFQRNMLEMERRSGSYYSQLDSELSEEQRREREKDALAAIQAKRDNQRAKDNQHKHDWYWRDPEHARELQRKCRSKPDNRRRSQKYNQQYRLANREYKRAYSAHYYAEHREEELERKRRHWENIKINPFAHGYYKARKRIYAAARRVTDPVYAERRRQNWKKWYRNNRERLNARLRKGNMTQEEITQATRRFEQQVLEARAAGFKWREIAQLLNRVERTCRAAYKRAINRLAQQQQDNEAA